MHMPFPTHKLLFIKGECAVRMCALHRLQTLSFVEPDVGEMIQWSRSRTL